MTNINDLQKVKWKCKKCGGVYEDSDICPLCDSKERIKASDSEEIDSFLTPKPKEKYIARYKKGRPIFKKTKK